MLSCGKVIGHLSKITRHAHATHLQRSPKYDGIGIRVLRFNSNNTKDKKPSKPLGTTATAEECTPKSQLSKTKKIVPACEQPNYTCPPECEEVCNVNQKSSGGSGDHNKWSNLSQYWKPLLATFILTGITIYATTHLQDKSTKSREDTESMKKVKKKKEKSKRAAIKVPPDSKLIPSEVPYLLIGGGTAAFSAFRSIKSKDPKAKVLVITDEQDLPYMRPPLSKELWYNRDKEASSQLVFRQWNGTKRSVLYEPFEFYTNVSKLTTSDKGGVSVATGWKVKKIDASNKIAVLDNGHEIKYEKCLIATGATPKNLEIFESAEDEVKEKIIPYRTIDNFIELEANVNNSNVKNIVIIGGGFLGSELACSLARNLNKDQKKIYQIFKEKSIMAQILPEYLCKWITEKMTAEGVHCIPNAEVKDYVYKNGKLSLVLTGGQIIDSDQVVVAIGVQPNTQLAADSQLEVDPEIGGFLVNAELEARSNLWVAGDVACFYDVQLGRRRVEHHDHAVISGRLAGDNMTGAGKPYVHQSMFWSDLGPEIGYEAIGIIDSALPTVAVFAKGTDQNTPLAAVTAAGEAMRSTTSEEETSKPNTDALSDKQETKEQSMNTKIESKSDQKSDTNSSTDSSKNEDTYGKGVIFYLRDDMVVGIVLWNIFNRMPVARQVLARGTHYDDLNEVAKLFMIHED